MKDEEAFLIDPMEEYRRLSRIYRDYGDVELLNLAREIDDLTDVGKQALQAEIASRQLQIPEMNRREDISSQDEPAVLGSFANLSSPECVFEFPEVEDAQAAGEMLGAAGITYDTILPQAPTWDAKPPRLAVLPEDVERVRELLSQPIPEEFRILVRTKNQFVVPSCPKCGSPDPLLDSIEPANHWICDACSHEWSDSIPG
jgi:hypothetical protein